MQRATGASAKHAEPEIGMVMLLGARCRCGTVESAFSMMKPKFGDLVRSKTDVAMVNETLCKVLAHNLIVLIHEMDELGIEPVFWPSPIAMPQGGGHQG